jgi:hypothetical protein
MCLCDVFKYLLRCGTDKNVGKRRDRDNDMKNKNGRKRVMDEDMKQIISC